MPPLYPLQDREDLLSLPGAPSEFFTPPPAAPPTVNLGGLIPSPAPAGMTTSFRPATSNPVQPAPAYVAPPAPPAIPNGVTRNAGLDSLQQLGVLNLLSQGMDGTEEAAFKGALQDGKTYAEALKIARATPKRFSDQHGQGIGVGYGALGQRVLYGASNDSESDQVRAWNRDHPDSPVRDFNDLARILNVNLAERFPQGPTLRPNPTTPGIPGAPATGGAPAGPSILDTLLQTLIAKAFGLPTADQMGQQLKARVEGAAPPAAQAAGQQALGPQPDMNRQAPRQFPSWLFPIPSTQLYGNFSPSEQTGLGMLAQGLGIRPEDLADQILRLAPPSGNSVQSFLSPRR